MFSGILIALLLVCGVAEGASINGTSKNNDASTSGRSGRTYDSPQQYLPIPVGYYKPEEESSTSSETENDSGPNRDVPTSFDDFIPSDRRTRNKYPGYSGKIDSFKGTPPKTATWKGDWSGGDNSPAWMTPSPADMAMMIKVMKDMNSVQTPSISDGLSGLLSKITADPTTLLMALLLPVAIILSALVPALFPIVANGNAGGIPTVTTTATGNAGRKLVDTPSFVRPIMEAIESFSARSASEHACPQKSFCEATRGSNSTDFRPIQKSIYKAFTFVDDYWLEALGVKQLMEAMGTGNCDKITCDIAQPKENDPRKKQA